MGDYRLSALNCCHHVSSPYLNVRFTAKQLFSAASIAFICESLICFVSSNFALLLIGRLIFSLGAGLATPLMFNLIVEIMPQKKWGFYMGLAGLIIAMAPTLGPSFGGLINYYWSWRDIFAVSAVFAILVFGLGLFVVGQYHQVQKPPFAWFVFL